MTKANECTCPSGDGSLRHPCPAHPASVELAGVAAKLTFINGRPAMCGCQVEYSSGGGEYSDVIYVTLCAKHSGSAILDLVATNRIALTPEYEGQWHADLYLDREIPLAKAEGATPAEAVLALMSAERIDPEQESVEQAGGDERDFQAKGAQEVPSPVSKEYDRHLIGLLRKGEALPGHQEEAADEIERLRDWNDHLNNTVLPNILNPNFLMLMKGGERLLDLCTKDGKFIGVSLNDMKDVFDWMVTHARIAPDHAALAKPSPKCATCNGSGQVWISDEPQRHFEDCPDCAQPSLAPTEGFSHFPELLESVQQIDAMLKAEAERPEVVGYRVSIPDEPELGHWLEEEDESEPQIQHHEPLMSVAQHERIVGALRAEIAEWQEAAGRGRSDVVAYIAERAKLLEGRDAALARVAEMEAKLSDPTAVHQWQFSNAWFDGSEEVVLKAGKEGSPIRTLYTAPPAQAQQLHDLDKQCRDDVARALGLRPSQERGFAWSYLLASIKSCVKASEDAAQAQHSVPERLELTDDLKNILGRPNFTCTHLAQALRQIGFVIDRKAEAEQAACLHWMLNHYLANGANWKVHAEAELKAAAPGKEVGHE